VHIGPNPIILLTTPTLTKTPTGTFTPTPSAFFFVPSFNANCRSGPNSIFTIFDVALKGKSYPLDGRNLDGSWYRIMLTADQGCWVPSTAGTTSGDPKGVRVLIEPPTPTLTAVPPTATLVACSSFKDEKSCVANPRCGWSITATTGAGSCNNK
jgi:hypothetical protein